MRNKAIAFIGAIAACAMTLAGIPGTAMASEATELNPIYTYNAGNGMTFEKVSHADQDLQQADGVDDYNGNGTIAPYTSGLSATGNSDRGQSYSYAAASYGDWVYIGTMYGGLGVQNILSRGFSSNMGLTTERPPRLCRPCTRATCTLASPTARAPAACSSSST